MVGEIRESDKDGYHFLAINYYDNPQRTEKLARARVITMTIESFERLRPNQKNSGFIANAHELITFHNPMIVEEPTIKPLAPKHKTKAKEMLEEGKSSEDIAKALNVDKERVENFIKNK